MPAIPINQLNAGDASPKLARPSLLLAVQAINNLYSFLDPDTDTTQLAVTRNVNITGVLTASGGLTGNAATATLATKATALATARTIGMTGDLSYTSAAFDGSGNVTGNALLATVNPNVGTFGSNSQTLTITANSKGLVTAISSAAIAIAASQVTSGVFANSLISQSSVTQYQSVLSIAETQITPGSILARLNSNQTVTGLWSFSQQLSANLTGALSGNVLAATFSNMNDVHLSGLQSFLSTNTTSNIPGTQPAGGGLEYRRSANTTTASAGSFQFFVSNDALNNFWLRKLVTNNSPQPNEVWGAWSRILTDQDTLTVASAAMLTTARTISITGDATWTTTFDGSANVTAALTLATVNSNSVSGAFVKVTTNTKGLVTATTPVIASDITSLVNATYVAKTGDIMTGALNIGNANIFGSLLEVSGPGSTYQTVFRYSADTTGPGFNFIKSRGATAAATTAVAAGDNLGNLYFQGLDGSVPQAGAIISGIVDGAVSAGVVPTALTFQTSATNSAGLTERMRITSAGNVGIGISLPSELLHLEGGVALSQRYGVSGAFVTRRAEGTSSSPTVVNTIDSSIGIWVSRAYDGAVYRDVANITMTAAAATSSTSSPGNITFNTTPIGSVVSVERMRITSAGNVGIGTSNPGWALDVVSNVAGRPVARILKTNSGTASEGGGTLYISNQGPLNAARTNGTLAGRIIWQYAQPTSGALQDGAAILSSADGNQNGTGTQAILSFYTSDNTAGGNNIERMRIDSVGRIGVGNITPPALLTIGNLNSGTSEATNKGFIQIQSNGGTSPIGGAGLEFKGSSSNSGFGWSINTPDLTNSLVPLCISGRVNSAAWTEVMRLDLFNQYVCFGNTAAGGITPANGVNIAAINANTQVGIGHVSGTSNGTVYLNFSYNATSIGSITQNGTTGVLFNTTSDYRLKDITGTVTESGAFIDALKPRVGTWKADGSKFVGFLAHEFQEVSPSSVNGEKDAIDKDEKPIMQSMQASSPEVMANMIAELQSLRARNAVLEDQMSQVMAKLQMT